MSSRSLEDRALARCSGVIGLIPVGNQTFRLSLLPIQIGVHSSQGCVMNTSLYIHLKAFGFFRYKDISFGMFHYSNVHCFHLIFILYRFWYEAR